MKMKMMMVAGAVIGLLALAGCANGMFSGTSAPTKAQEAAFNIVTNYVPVVFQETNVVEQTNTVTVLQTNTVLETQVQTVTVTNQSDQVNVVTVTNTVTTPEVVTVTNVVVSSQLNVVTVTNESPNYTYTPNATSQATAAAIGAVVNGFAPGMGTLTTTGLIALLGLLGWGYSAKTGSNQATAAAAMSQEIETFLEFVGQLPNGAAYTTAITSWLQSHQVSTGSAQTILKVMENEVSNPAAKAAVATILASLNTVNATTVTAAQVNAAQAVAAMASR